MSSCSVSDYVSKMHLRPLHLIHIVVEKDIGHPKQGQPRGLIRRVKGKDMVVLLFVLSCPPGWNGVILVAVQGVHFVVCRMSWPERFYRKAKRDGDEARESAKENHTSRCRYTHLKEGHPQGV